MMRELEPDDSLQAILAIFKKKKQCFKKNAGGTSHLVETTCSGVEQKQRNNTQI